jgi:hypothetical protein
LLIIGEYCRMNLITSDLLKIPGKISRLHHHLSGITATAPIIGCDKGCLVSVSYDE